MIRKEKATRYLFLHTKRKRNPVEGETVILRGEKLEANASIRLARYEDVTLHDEEAHHINGDKIRLGAEQGRGARH